jgi:hypothetical protein
LRHVCSDTISITHPNAQYFPNRLLGYEYWSVLSIADPCGESTILRVSHDGRNWVKLPGCPDPLQEPSDFIDSTYGAPPHQRAYYASDPDLFTGADGRIWVVTRAFFSGGSHVTLYVRSTADGITWTPNTRILPVQSGDAIVLSPAIWRDSQDRYNMWVVNWNFEKDGKIRGRILLYDADRPDQIWRLVDTVRQRGTAAVFPAGLNPATVSDDSIWIQQYTPWHVGLIETGTDEQIVLLTCADTLKADHPEAGVYVNFVGRTTDGRSLELRTEPLIRPTFRAGALDSEYVYKATGWFGTGPSRDSLFILYAGMKSRGIWQVGLTAAPLRGLPTDATSPLLVMRRKK